MIKKDYLDFKDAKCKNCYKCLRECPVKAIDVTGHQAKIIRDRCILCGKCTHVCPQNAKKVHSDIEIVESMLSSGKVIASVAPSFVSSFNLTDFSVMKIALGKLGFAGAEETAIGARIVVDEYEKLLSTNGMDNFITSCCPAVNRLIQLYYPRALKYLAPVVSPMVAHAKVIKANNPDVKVVFIGPCIAKKMEADKSGVVDATLTYSDLIEMFNSHDITLENITDSVLSDGIESYHNSARFFPISRGIVKSFKNISSNYEYVAIDGIDRIGKALENIDSIKGVFLELNACEQGCINGPCSLLGEGGALKANSQIRAYTTSCGDKTMPNDIGKTCDFSLHYERKRTEDKILTDKEIESILHKMGKFSPEDELNCGACGYSSCREKAWAVANGFAEVEMCLPYMREKAESMSYEIIQNNPNGIIVVNDSFKITEINGEAKRLCKVGSEPVIGENLVDFIDPTEFFLAMSDGKNRYKHKLVMPKTNATVEATVIVLKNHKMLFAVLKDITDEENNKKAMLAVKQETLKTANEVINKQMRVAQEIASLLGETTAETKVALYKLKQSIAGDEEK